MHGQPPAAFPATHAPAHARRAAARLLPALVFLLGAALLGAAAPPARAAGVTLNFKDADLATVIAWVAEQTGKNYIVDPRVKGRVTIVSGRPLEPEEIEAVFLAVLEVHGFAAVPAGPATKIVPEVRAKQAGVPLADAEHPGRGAEFVTRVIPVEHVPAAQLVPILRPLVPQQGHMVAYPPSNVLIVSDRAANIERLARIIAKVDRPSRAGEIEVLPLEHAAASEVVRILQALQAQSRQQGAGKQGPVLVADERTNSVLLSGGTQAERLRLRAIVSHLDTPLEREGDIHVIYLRYANAKELAPVLTGIGQRVLQQEQGQAQGGQAARAAREFDVQADESANALVITAPPKLFRSLEAVVRKLDVRRAQVQVEAIIAEMSLSRAAELGVQWGFGGSGSGVRPVGAVSFQAGSGASLGELGAAAASGQPPAQLPDGLTLGVGRLVNNRLDFGALLRLLQSDAATNILSTPTLVTLDNQEAEIVVGQNVPFVTGAFANVAGSATPTNPFQTIQRRNVGITLKVRPQINEGDAVKLEVEQSVDSLAPNNQGAVDVVTNTRHIRTSVLVDDGQVVVLGGLITENLRERTQRLPVLGRLPLIGSLFRYRTSTKEKTNLMVFLRPVIVRDPALMSQVAAGKYDFIRARQLELRRRGVPLMPGEETPVMPPLERLRREGATPAPPPAPSPAPQSSAGAGGTRPAPAPPPP